MIHSFEHRKADAFKKRQVDKKLLLDICFEDKGPGNYFFRFFCCTLDEYF